MWTPDRELGHGTSLITFDMEVICVLFDRNSVVIIITFIMTG